MPRLTEPVKEHVVTRLACYRGAVEVQRELKEVYGLEVSLQQIAVYDPEVPSTKTPKKWVQLHAATREAYLKAKAEVGIANERWRMERRQLLYQRAESMGANGNIPLCLQILEQAEKAEGGQFTNRHKHDHSGKVEGGVLLVPVAAEADWDAQAKQSQAAVADEAA